MSLASEPQAAESAAPGPTGGARCERCGAPLAPDQEWCFQCGVARTVVHPPPDWRVPVIVVATIVLLVLAAFAIALVELAGA